MRKRDLIHIIEGALVYKMDDGGDIPAVIDCLLEGVRGTLKCDTAYREFHVLFAAFAEGARRPLGEYARAEWTYAAQHVDWEYAARNVTEAVSDEVSQESDPDDGGAP